MEVRRGGVDTDDEPSLCGIESACFERLCTTLKNKLLETLCILPTSRGKVGVSFVRVLDQRLPGLSWVISYILS